VKLLSRQFIYLFFAASWFSCESRFPSLGIADEEVVPGSIVSVYQPESATRAEIEVKVPNKQAEIDRIKLQLLDSSGNVATLKPAASYVTGNFSLNTYVADNLQPGMSYQVVFNYTDSKNKSTVLTRNFTSRISPSWKKLSHAPIAGGDHTGAALLSPLYNAQLAIYRYMDAVHWDILKFINGKWESSESMRPVPRHSSIAFPLGQTGGRELIFMGFGYINDEKLPGKRAYLSDMWWTAGFFSIGTHSGTVLPGYSNIDREVKFFLTYDTAYMLKEEDSGAMWAMDVKWDQRACSPLPERTGKLVAFSINDTGYIVNQVPGEQPRLYTYAANHDIWVRRADFPGVPRTDGVGFSAGGKAYYGLGTDKQGRGLRDLWEYDPAKNSWKYHSEYPGEGNRYLISFSDKGRAFLGWGYEYRAVKDSDATEQIGCTDFWEFHPQ
jgi:hypothetical protein